ncbi:S-adenosyl-L-methionine-dependent methyltransferase [Cyathus striatus]|nr:S-adenosyl-L-methionine-dependent methyltransferase [Cyathus striatus]
MVLTHPSIVDGWFREISSQWPGQAMTLKVRKVLHIEKSLYQDVLVFESETFGNVLVLDGVIQFLVIGGGDGGVVREVLKHDAVEQVVLCDIDEAVVCVSKTYLPHMNIRRHNHRLLRPRRPAQSLFQKPYFQLLHDALTPGGHISTQAESIWIHLPLIQNLKNMTSQIFSSSEYAYTTIPSYPSGQIGFMVCAKSPGRDLRIPLREVKGTRYYNSALHKSAFVLPEFVRASLEEGKDLQPKFGREALVLLNKPKKKVLLLGSGFVARPAAEYIVRDPSNSLTIACRTLASAEALADGLPSTSFISLDVNDVEALEVPWQHTTSYISPAMRELDEEAKKAGVVVMNEIGLDPGIDHLYAVKTIDEVHAKGGKVCFSLFWVGRLRANGLCQTVLYSPAYAFVAYPNRNSAETVVRGTLRYAGFPEFVKALVQLGWLDAGEKGWLSDELTWAEVSQRVVVRLFFRSDRSIIERTKEIFVSRAKNLLDTLCARLEVLMKYETGERDLIMLQHKFYVEWADGKEDIITSTLEAYGSPSGHSAMALTVGLPCGIATQLVLDGVISTPGVLAPYTKEICDPIREILEAEGVALLEEVL